MISAAVTFLDISTWVLMFIFAIVCLLMSTVILMQRPKNEGLGAAFGSGTTDQLFGARTTNVLQKGTVYLASSFFILVLVISILINRHPRAASLVATPTAATAPAETPAAPDATMPPVITPAPSSEESKPLETEPKAPDTATPPATDETKPAAPPETPAPETTPPAEKPAEEPK